MVEDGTICSWSPGGDRGGPAREDSLGAFVEQMVHWEPSITIGLKCKWVKGVGLHQGWSIQLPFPSCSQGCCVPQFSRRPVDVRAGCGVGNRDIQQETPVLVIWGEADDVHPSGAQGDFLGGLESCVPEDVEEAISKGVVGEDPLTTVWTGKEMVAEGVQLLTTFASCDLAKTRVGKPKAKAKGREELVVVEAAWAEREGGRDPKASVG